LSSAIADYLHQAHTNLELELVGEHVLGEREASRQVSLEGGSLVDDGEQLAIDSLLVSLAVISEGLLLLLVLLGQEISLGLLLLGLLLLGEVGIVNVLGNLNRGNINVGRGGNDVSLVDALQRNTVNLVGS
jgi:hypothetical protein